MDSEVSRTLHSLDKRINGLEILIAERNLQSAKDHTQIIQELQSIQKDVGSLQVKASRTSAIVAVIVTALTKFFFH